MIRLYQDFNWGTLIWPFTIHISACGPMQSGLSNSEKAKVRQQFAAGEVGEKELLQAESKAYHSPGTCTFMELQTAIKC